MLFWYVIFPPFNQEVVKTPFPLNLDNLTFTLTSGVWQKWYYVTTKIRSYKTT